MTAVKKTRKPSIEQQALVRGLWEANLGSQGDIAKEAGVTVEQVRYMIKEKGWVKGIRAEYYENKARELIESEISAAAKELAVKKDSARDQAVKISNIIEQKMIGEFKAAQDAKLSIATLGPAFKALEMASRINQNSFHTKRFALGMDQEEIQTIDEDLKLEILEMSADEIELIREKQEKDYKEMDVVED
jgi:hypothetical protein